MFAALRTAAAAALLLAVAGSSASPRPLAHFADAADLAGVKRGRVVYMGHCASCHGRYLQGQPLWQTADGDAHRRAPAHDSTGHTWEHDDEALFNMTKFGHFDDALSGAPSFMPAFRNKLGDRDILAAIAFIKARWPVGMRVLQALRNPGHAGMPPGADHAGWTFPVNCEGGRTPARPTGFDFELTAAAPR